MMEGRCSKRISSHQHQKHLKKCIRLDNNNCIVKDSKPASKGYYIPKWVLCYMGVGIVAVACYANSVGGQFVHDDVMAIKTNPDIRPETPISSLLSNDFWGRPMTDYRSHKSYRPICVLTFRLNYKLGGLDPYGYHVVNIMLHTIAALLFTYVCRFAIFYHQVHLAALAGLLFAVHPIHTEAVSGVVGRADVLCSVFYLMSFISYHRCVASGLRRCRARHWGYLALSLVLAAAAMLSKEQGVTVLALCLGYDFMLAYHRYRLSFVQNWNVLFFQMASSLKRNFITSISLLLLLSGRLWMNHGHLPPFTDEDNPASFQPNLLSRVLSYWYVYGWNAWLLLFPWHLSYDWQMGSLPLVHSLWDHHNLLSLALVIALVGLVYHATWLKQMERQRCVLLGLMLLLLPFLPASNLIIRVGFVVAERLLYIPSMGLCVLVVHVCQELGSRLPPAAVTPARRRLLLYAALLGLAALWGVRTVCRNHVWRDRNSLFSSGLQSLPHNAKMHYNYANLLRDKGSLSQALHHYETALDLWPTYASAHNNLAVLTPNMTAARLHWRAALRHQPCHVNSHVNLANHLREHGDLDAARVHLDQAVQCEDTSAAVHSGLGNYFQHINHLDDAEQHYRLAANLDPFHPSHHHNLGLFLEHLGKTEDSYKAFKNAFVIDPEHHVGMRHAARALKKLHRVSEARRLYERALALSRDVTTLDMAGVFYFNQRSVGRALQLFREAHRKDPHSATVLLHLALGSAGDTETAEELLTAHLTEHGLGGSMALVTQLANVYGQRQLHGQAVDLLQQALALVTDARIQAELHLHLGKHLKDLNNMQQAFQNYKDAVRLNARSAEAQHALAVFYHKQADVARAKFHYTVAQTLEPHNKLVRENLHKLLATEQESGRPQEPPAPAPSPPLQLLKPPANLPATPPRNNVRKDSPTNATKARPQSDERSAPLRSAAPNVLPAAGDRTAAVAAAAGLHNLDGQK